MSRALKLVLSILLVIIIFAISVFIIRAENAANRYIGKSEAALICFADAGLEKDARCVDYADAELKKTENGAFYEVVIDSGGTEYNYLLDAYTGKILSAKQDIS